MIFGKVDFKNTHSLNYILLQRKLKLLLTQKLKFESKTFRPFEKYGTHLSLIIYT